MSEPVDAMDQSGAISPSHQSGMPLLDPAAQPPLGLDESTRATERPLASDPRTSPFGRLGRILLERRRPIVNSIGIAAATLLLMAGTVAAWRTYTEWRQGRIELITDGAPVVCQVIAEMSDDPIGEPFDLVTRAIVALPAGEYRLRVNGTGRLGRTFRFTVNRGETQTHAILIDEGRLLGGERAPDIGSPHPRREVPIPFAPVIAALELTPGKADLIEWSASSLLCRDGATGKTKWDAFQPATPIAANRDPAHWMRNLSAQNRQGKLIEPAPDLDGDGTHDLLWVFPSDWAFLALSGKDGSMLWNHVIEIDGAGGPKPDGPEVYTLEKPSPRSSSIIGTPAMADVDRDGTLDLISTIVFWESNEEAKRRRETKSPVAGARDDRRYFRRQITAISGRSGRSLWICPVFTPHEDWRQPATLVRGRQSALIVLMDDTKWLAVDPASGKPQAESFDIGYPPIRPVQHADLDGDGEPEILALSPGPAGKHYTLRTFSTKTGQEMWNEPVGAVYDQSESGGPVSDFPLIVDLDGDGRSEVVAADTGSMPPLSGYRGVKLLDGVSGQPRWRRPMRPDTKSDDGLTEVIAAPDLDGDGTCDLVTVSLYEGKNPSPSPRTPPDEPERVYVDAISGKDGSPLWWWSVDLPIEAFTRIWKPQWWGRGPDGWPLLAIALGGAQPDDYKTVRYEARLHPPTVHLLEASPGKHRHTINGLTKPRLADLNGDGLADLWGNVEGELRAFRAETPEAWRALGEFHPADERRERPDILTCAGVDFDGDGIRDTLLLYVQTPGGSARRTTGSRTALARSGRDGHVLWKSVLDRGESWFEPSRGDRYGVTAFPLPAGDFDGDGTPDVIITRYVYQMPGGQATRRAATLPLQVLSGRSGRSLWSAGRLPLGFDAQGYSRVIWIEARAVDPGGTPDLLVSHGSPFPKPGTTRLPRAARGRPSLTRISGRDGRIIWDVSLAEGEEEGFQDVPPPRLADLNGDGGLDVLVVVPPIPIAGQTEFQLLAVSLRDGKRLWSQRLQFQFNLGCQLCVGDLDGDQRPDVVVAEDRVVGNRIELEVRAFDGLDGKVRWDRNIGPILQGVPSAVIALAYLEGNGAQDVCVNFKEPGGMRRILVLDAAGKERIHRDVTGDDKSILNQTDFNGDGHDELLVWYGDRVHALGRDLHDLWSWPNESAAVEQILAASPGRPGAVIIQPALALGGATGQPLWTGQSPLFPWPPSVAPRVLDPGDSARTALLIGNNQASTVCRMAMPTTPEGRIAPPRSTLVRRARIPDDPRWLRPLPWLPWLNGPVGPWGFLAAFGLAFINVVLPLSIVRMVAGRRLFSIRALMALPLAAAIPIMVFLMLEPVLPVGSTPLLGSERRLFIAGTAAGLPIVLTVVFVALSLARGRWRPLATLCGLTLLTSLVIAAIWICVDIKSMSALERYGKSGWYLIALPAVYAASTLVLIGWITRGIFAFVRRLGSVPRTGPQ
jgi:PQQ-like domain